MEGETMKPFRWTKQHKNIRVLLNDGYSKDRILRLIRKACIDHRASEAAMTVADWSVAIDRVQQRLSQ
jgi:hypothetical protein